MPSFSFKKEEKLKSRKIIQGMFTKGQSFGAYPLRIVWIPLEENDGEYPVRFALTVAKKKFPKAAHRNRLRRRIREAWRLHKHILYKSLNKIEGGPQYAFMIMYTAKEELPYSEIEAAMKKIIFRFRKKAMTNHKRNE